MIVPSQEINVFKRDTASAGSWFTGKLNTQLLDFDPLVTGYSFIIWTKVPFWVEAAYPNFKDMTQKNFKAFDGLSDIELQSGDIQHTFSGNTYSYAQTINKGNTDFSIQHQEFSGNPIKNMYTYWVSGMRDIETDIAPYCKIHNVEYAAKNHTGELLYIVTRPDANNVDMHNIEFAAYYTAVYPSKIPIGHFNYSQGTHDSPVIDQNFKGDLHIGAEVDAFAAEKLKESYAIVTANRFDPNDGTIGDGFTLGTDTGESTNIETVAGNAPPVAGNQGGAPSGGGGGTFA